MSEPDLPRTPSEQDPATVAAASGEPRRSGCLTRARLVQGGLCLVLLAAMVVFAWAVNDHYPLRHWLFFGYARSWLFALLFMAANLAAGLRVAQVLPRTSWLGERWTIALATGAVVFALGIYLGGLVGLIGHIFFFVWPALMMALGARATWREIRMVRRRLGRFGWRLFMPRSGAEILAVGLLGVALVGVYLQVMTPLNVGGDSYWYHLPIAEHYAASGAIRPFAEGWYLGAYPHLASWYYTWAFLAPGEIFDHVTLSSHLEWMVFLATLGGVASLTRRLLGGRRVPFAGAAVFLFPGLFLYDSSLITGADHILAFWAPAMGISLLRLRKRFSVAEAALAGALLGAAIATKYQASYFFVPAALLVLYLMIRRWRILPALAWAGACLLVSSPHWLKNWIAYGDPFYPLLYKYLPVHPFHPGAGDRMYWDAQFLLTGSFWEKVQKTLVVLPTFSFVPHDWEGFHGSRPVFGSLFTLLLPALLFLRKMGRTWLMVAAVHMGVVVWFVTNHQDRYLQALLPWMAACTAAVLVMAWHKGLAVRAALVLLVAFQLVWGGDVYFIRFHGMIGDSPLKALVDHLGLGQQKRYADQRRLHGGSLQAVGARLPPDTKVVVHEKHDRLGLGTASISDTLCWQGAYDYSYLDPPDAAVALWRKMGATHVMWWDDFSMPWHDYFGREAVFARAVDLWGDDAQNIDDKHLTKLQPASRAPDRSREPTKIAWLTCREEPPMGLYTPRGLVEKQMDAPLAEDQIRTAPLDAFKPANVVILRFGCEVLGKAASDVSIEFKRIDRAGEFTVWVRK